ncbi:MAG TPA: hypothetical protein VF688_10095, partial [Allosphingosinicella sp.]
GGPASARISLFSCRYTPGSVRPSAAAAAAARAAQQAGTIRTEGRSAHRNPVIPAKAGTFA